MVICLEMGDLGVRLIAKTKSFFERVLMGGNGAMVTGIGKR